MHLWNTAERMKLATALAIATVDPEFPLIIIDQAERLDATQREILRDMFEAASVVGLAMMVGQGADCQIILSDGQAVGAEQWADDVLDSLLEIPS